MQTPLLIYRSFILIIDPSDSINKTINDIYMLTLRIAYIKIKLLTNIKWLEGGMIQRKIYGQDEKY